MIVTRHRGRVKFLSPTKHKKCPFMVEHDQNPCASVLNNHSAENLCFCLLETNVETVLLERRGVDNSRLCNGRWRRCEPGFLRNRRRRCAQGAQTRMTPRPLELKKKMASPSSAHVGTPHWMQQKCLSKIAAPINWLAATCSVGDVQVSSVTHKSVFKKITRGIVKFEAACGPSLACAGCGSRTLRASDRGLFGRGVSQG